jgi:hypothetical protein
MIIFGIMSTVLQITITAVVLFLLYFDIFTTKIESISYLAIDNNIHIAINYKYSKMVIK